MQGMLGVRRKYRIRRFFGGSVAFVVILVLLLIVAQAGIGMYAKSKEAEAKRDLALAELHRLEAREASLQAEISRLSNERGVEEELRDRFFVAKEGEKVAIVSAMESKDGDGAQQDLKKSLWKKFLSAVGLSSENQ